VLEQFENDMAGVVPDTVILNPTDKFEPVDGLGRTGSSRWREVLADFGIENIHSTVKQTVGTAVFAKSKQVGTIAFEKPLEQEQGRGPTGTWKDIFALEMQPVFVALDASAVLAVTGLNA
jgi:hypothetical protein